VKKQDTLENRAKVVYLAIGSNLGNKVYNIEITKIELEKYKIKILKSSSKYLSESWPDNTKPKFINSVIKVKTYLEPFQLLKVCKIIEFKMGRVKTKINAPRICDIDIIDYDQNLLNEKKKNLILPHPRMDNRIFVLLPLFEIEKSWKHPETKINIVKLISSLPVKDLRSIKQI
tara:strand:+ start:194 stop:715 length:522 start_codon:yes stop_codon:yes gene_type:complete